MNKIPTITSSAQARILIYKLLSLKLNKVEKQLLDSNPTLWDEILVNLENLLNNDNQIKSDEIILKQAFAYIERSANNSLQKQMVKLSGQSLWLGVFPQGLLDSFIAEHQQLIKSVRREHLDKISLAIKRGFREGRLAKDMAKEIRLVTDISKHRARLIARNASLQYSGSLTKHHQINAGIKKYRWQTSHDERVRVSHKKLDGKIFAWDSPGPHPRSEVNCRCDAVPVLK